MRKIKQIFSLFLLWRLFLFLPLYLGFLFFPYRQGAPYTNLWDFIEPYSPVNHFLLFPWANFDGVHYLSIAGDGYQADGTNSRFFPLFPLLIRAVSEIFGAGVPFGLVYFLSGLFLSNFFLFLTLFIFYKLLRLDYPSKTSLLILIFLLVFPTSFYFASIYSESLFLLLSLLSFYFARKKQWFWAGFSGMLAATTRIVGIFLFPVLIYEFVTQERKGKWINWSLKILPLFLIPLGLLSYSLFNFWRSSNALFFLTNQGQVGNERSIGSLVLLPQTLFRYAKILTALPFSQFEWWLALFELAIFFFISFLLYLAWQKKIRRSYLLFSLLCFLAPVSSGTFSGLPRYVLVLFPLFMTLALVKKRIIQISYVVISLILLFFLLMFFSRGYFIA